MYELKQIGKVFTSKSVWTRPSSYGKRIYRAAVSQRLRNTGIEWKGNVARMMGGASGRVVFWFFNIY